MKILLINPPRSPENKILEYAPEEAKKYIHKKLIGPPLGLLVVAEALREHDVTLFDMKGEYDLNPETVDFKTLTLELLNKHKPDIVGVTVIASEFYFAVDILKTAKKFNRSIVTVAGGLHATLCTNDFKDSDIDIVCAGQSALLFKDLADALENHRKPESVKGIYINTENGLKYTGTPDRIINPATTDYIYPNRNLLKRWINTYKVGGSPFPSTYMFTSLGCPYKCTFCSIWPQFDGGFYQRDVESIIKELKSIDDYPIVRFSDANTVVNIDFINKLFDRIKEEKIEKSYIMDIRSDTAVRYPELIKKMAENGLKVVICGFESFREEELKKYNKGSEANLISKAIDIFHENGVQLRGNYVIPYDYTKDDFKAMSDYAGSHKVTYAGYTILTPMPGTIYYDEVKDLIIDHDLSKYNFFNSVMKTTLPLDDFYNEVGKLWLIKKGKDVI